MIDTPHPGRLLRRDYLEPRGLSIADAAKALAVSRQTLTKLVNGGSGISPEMAIRLAKEIGGKAETWQRLQRDYDLAQARSNRVGSQPLWLRSEHLVNWANTTGARYTFPHLVRRLIGYEGDAIRALDFPAYEDAQSAGWDGLVESADESRYVPSGLSVWELSTEKDPQGKATRDYEKRKLQSFGFKPEEVTYVAATARRWKSKEKWAAERSREGFWKQVLAYDATTLEQWLELATPVAVWFATLIGLRVEGVQSLESFWDEFRRGTSPPITPELMLAGRRDGEQRLRIWLREGTGVFRILADSPDEAAAFVAAAAANADSTKVFATSVLVTDMEAARHVITTGRPLTLMWRIDDPSLIPRAVEEGHRIIVPLGCGASTSDDPDIELPRLGREEFVKALKESLSAEDERARERDAETIARRTSRSLTVYRRLYTSSGVVKAPEWARPQPDQTGSLMAALLAGNWTEGNEADKAVVSELAASDYAAIARSLTRWWNQPDSPVRRAGHVWSLAAPLDSWSRLARLLTNDDIERFEAVVIDVLSAHDPSLDLDPRERWLANVRGKKFKHSGELREGLANSLILLGMVGDQAGLHIGRQGADVADGLVARLLGETEPGRWASLASLLPRIAEASPREFLGALEADLQHGTPVVLELFEDEGGITGAGGRYPSLLWALEMLAWEPEHLSRSARLLARLGRMAPEVKLWNKPGRSLREIFCTWHPNTAAPLTERMQTLDHLLGKEPDVTWKLIVALLPQNHDVGHNTAEPRWRAKPERGPVTIGEVRQSVNEVVQRALLAAGQNSERLAELIGGMATWSSEQRAELRQQVEGIASSAAPDKRTLLWHTVRDFLSSHRSFRDADWSLPEAELVPWDATCIKLEPEDPIERCVWLFDEELPRLPQADASSFDERFHKAQGAVADARRDAVSRVQLEKGMDGVFEIARRAKKPWLVGFALAEVIDQDDAKRDVLECTLGHDEDAVRHLGLAFVGAHERDGTEWAETIRQSSMFQRWSPEKQADFCLGLSSNRGTWDFVSRLETRAQQRYWANAHVWVSFEDSNETAEIAARRLLGADRVFKAVEQASYHHAKMSSQTLIEVLRKGVQEIYDEANHRNSVPDTHYFEEIFGALRNRVEIAREDLAKLEWQYLPLLRLHQTPQTLHSYLEENPDFFAEVLSHIYKPEEEQDEEGSDGTVPEQLARNRATLGYELLRSWHRVPGRNEDGGLDGEYLADWFKKARVACSERKRSTIGDLQIGNVLAHAPVDKDGVWPHRVVRDLIEDAESKEIERGVAQGLFNRRGVTSRSPFEGGRMERELAANYRGMARALRTHWPRTAALLREVADTYEAQGRGEDNRAELLDMSE